MTVKELMSKVEDLPSYIVDDDFIIYHRYLPLIYPMANVLDLGTGWGKSVCIMALLNSDIKITTIDNGYYPVYQRWASSLSEYEYKLNDIFRNKGINNIELIIDNIDNVELSRGNYKLVHIDLTQEEELKSLIKVIPGIQRNGLLLLRNYIRNKNEFDKLLDEFELIDNKGLIYVFRRFR